jgi:hypothetical protein
LFRTSYYLNRLFCRPNFYFYEHAYRHGYRYWHHNTWDGPHFNLYIRDFHSNIYSWDGSDFNSYNRSSDYFNGYVRPLCFCYANAYAPRSYANAYSLIKTRLERKTPAEDVSSAGIFDE